MVTVVNPAPNNSSSDGGGMGFLVGVILIIIFGVMFFVYGLPMIQNAMKDGVNVNVHPDEVKITAPESTESTQ